MCPAMFDELRSNLRLSYDQKANQRDKRTVQTWKLTIRTRFLDMLHQEQKLSFLEIGAGTGLDSLYFQKRGLRVTCIDLSSKMVNLCQKKGLNAYEMDVAHLEFAPDSFDAVYSLNSLLHVPQAQLRYVLKEINTVLRPQGLFYLGVYGGYQHEGIWTNDSYQPQRFFSFFNDVELKKRVGEVFDLISFETIAFDEGESGLHFQSCILKKRSIKEERCK